MFILVNICSSFNKLKINFNPRFDKKVTEVEAFAQKIAQQEDAVKAEKSVMEFFQSRVDDVKNKGLKGEIEKLHTRIAELLMINEKHQQLNGKLQTRLTEVEEDNKKLTQQINDLTDVVGKLRKSGAF